MTDSHDTLTALDALIQSRSILQHPFYVAWQKGTLTREQLATYARVYWPHVAAFPSYLEAAARLTDDVHIQAVLEAGGSSLDAVVKVTVFLARESDMAAMNEIYRTYFKAGEYPARTAIEVNLQGDFLVEIECVAEA